MTTRTRWTKAAAVAALLGCILAAPTFATAAAVAYWRLDNDGKLAGETPSGTPFIDQTGNHNAVFFGTTANSHWSADVPVAQVYDPSLSGFVANALSFELGVNSMIQAGLSTTLPTASSATPFTFECFVRAPDAFAESKTLFEHRSEDAQHSGVELLLTSDRRLQLRTTHNNAPQSVAYGSTALGDGAWHHVAAVWDGAKYTGYFDYLKMAEMTPAGTWNGGLTTGNFSIGRFNTSYQSGLDFTGSLDEIRISNAALGPADFLRATEALVPFQPRLIDATASLPAYFSLQSYEGQTNLTVSSPIGQNGDRSVSFEQGNAQTFTVTDGFTLERVWVGVRPGYADGDFEMELRLFEIVDPNAEAFPIPVSANLFGTPQTYTCSRDEIPGRGYLIHDVEDVVLADGKSYMLQFFVSEGGPALFEGPFTWDISGTGGSAYPGGAAFEHNVGDENRGCDYVFALEGTALPTLLGDADGDGVVDAEDASILGRNWLANGAGWAGGDFNADGVVDDKDAAILAAHWGQSDLAEPTGVPEPSTLILLAAGAGLGLLAAARRVAQR
jgi:hypothetical protein